MLWQIVRNLKPRRLRSNEDMSGGSDRGRIDQRAQRDVNETALSDDREQQGAAGAAVRVMALGRIAMDQQHVGALDDLQMIPSDAGEGFEGGAGGSAALGTVAVQCVGERIGDLVGHGAAETLSGQ
jgi:hypothetical protein